MHIPINEDRVWDAEAWTTVDVAADLVELAPVPCAVTPTHGGFAHVGTGTGLPVNEHPLEQGTVRTVVTTRPNGQSVILAGHEVMV